MPQLHYALKFVLNFIFLIKLKIVFETFMGCAIKLNIVGIEAKHNKSIFGNFEFTLPSRQV